MQGKIKNFYSFKKFASAIACSKEKEKKYNAADKKWGKKKKKGTENNFSKVCVTKTMLSKV